MAFQIDYARYYNLLYANKDYKAETEFVISLIKRYQPEGKFLLDVGCGTGRHASIFEKYGYSVTGIDVSEEMIKIARENYGTHNNLRFIQSSAQDFKLDFRFDIITSLFHVLSYQTTNAQVINALKNFSEHLNKGAICIFDFWYGPGVFTELPSIREKRIRDDKYEIRRVSNPLFRINENVIDVNFDVEVSDLESQKSETFSELHSMRYFFYPELQHFAEIAGLKIRHFSEWMSNEKTPDKNSWIGVIVTEKL